MVLTFSLKKILLQTAFLMTFGRYQVTGTIVFPVMTIIKPSMDLYPISLQPASTTKHGSATDAKSLSNFAIASMQVTFLDISQWCLHLTAQRMNCKFL